MLTDTGGPIIYMYQCMIFLSSVVQVADAGLLEGGSSLHYLFVCEVFV